MMAEPGAGQRVVTKAGSMVLPVGRDVISGHVFVGRFARLRDVWLDPVPVFDEVGVDQFAGSGWPTGSTGSCAAGTVVMW